MTAAVRELHEEKKNKKLKFGINGGGIGGLVLLGGVVAAGALATLFTNHMRRRKHSKSFSGTTQFDYQKEEQLNCRATTQKEDVQPLCSVPDLSDEHHNHRTINKEVASTITSTLIDSEESERGLSATVEEQSPAKFSEEPTESQSVVAEVKPHIIVEGDVLQGIEKEEQVQIDTGNEEIRDENRIQVEFVEEKIENDESGEEIDGYCFSELTNQVEEVKPQIQIQEEELEGKEREEPIQLDYGDESKNQIIQSPILPTLCLAILTYFCLVVGPYYK